MTLELRDTPLVFVDDLSTPELREVDFNHLTKSRRLSEGSEIAISDGQGRYRLTELAMNPNSLSDIQETKAPKNTTVYFPPVKNERPEYVVQKLTELGVRTIGLIETERSVIKWDSDKAVDKIQKLAEVARQGAMQSKQLWLPTVAGIHSLNELSDDSVCFAEPDGDEIEAGDLTIAIGPEGGFTEQELAGRSTRGLPGGVLRSETAAVAAATLLVC